MKNNKWSTSFLEELNLPENQKKIKAFRFARSLYNGNKDKYYFSISKVCDELDGHLHIQLCHINTFKTIWSTLTQPLQNVR